MKLCPNCETPLNDDDTICSNCNINLENFLSEESNYNDIDSIDKTQKDTDEDTTYSNSDEFIEYEQELIYENPIEGAEEIPITESSQDEYFEEEFEDKVLQENDTLELSFEEEIENINTTNFVEDIEIEFIDPSAEELPGIEELSEFPTEDEKTPELAEELEEENDENSGIWSEAGISFGDEKETPIEIEEELSTPIKETPHDEPKQYVDYDRSDIVDVEYEVIQDQSLLVDISEVFDEEAANAKSEKLETTETILEENTPQEIESEAIPDIPIEEFDENIDQIEETKIPNKKIRKLKKLKFAKKLSLPKVKRKINLRMLFKPFNIILFIAFLVSLISIFIIITTNPYEKNYSRAYLKEEEESVTQCITTITQLNSKIIEEFKLYYNGEKTTEQIKESCTVYLANGQAEIDKILKYKDINSREYIFYVEKSYYNVAIVADFIIKYTETNDDKYFQLAKENFTLIKDYSEDIKEEHQQYLERVK